MASQIELNGEGLNKVKLSVCCSKVVQIFLVPCGDTFKLHLLAMRSFDLSMVLVCRYLPKVQVL